MAKVGYRFHPTDFELIYFYLTNQILGNRKQVEETISEINFYDYDPVSLPALSRNQSNNGIYYFFAPKQYTNSSKSSRKRSSKYGKWKLSGGVTEIKDKSGEMIGDKQVLVYEYKNVDPKAKGIKSPWVMHEYQITHSKYHNLGTYVICKLFDKRENANVTYGNNNSSEPTHHPQVSDSKITPVPKVEQPGQEIDDLFIPKKPGQEIGDLIIPKKPGQEIDDLIIPKNILQDQDPSLSQADYEFRGELKPVEHIVSDQDFTMQENYRQKSPVRVINTLSEFEQPYHKNNYGMYVNDYTMQMNTQEDLSQCDCYDQDMLSQDEDDDNNNNIPNVQLQTQYYISQENDEFLSGLKHVNRKQVEHFFYEQDLTMHENPVRVINTLLEIEQPYYENSYMPQEDPNMRLHEHIMSEFKSLIPDQEFRIQENRNAESRSAMVKPHSQVDHTIGSSNTHFPSCKVVYNFGDLISQ